MKRDEFRRVGSKFRVAMGMAAALAGAAIATRAHAGTPVVAAGYQLSVFASPFANPGLESTIGGTQPTPMVSSPDDITVAGGNVFIGWGNGVAGDGGYGPNGVTSTVTEYSLSGTFEKAFNMAGHVEGIAVGSDGLLYTDQNEDGNSTLTVINTSTGQQTRYGYPNPSPHQGGFDGLQFVNGKLYASGSNAGNGAYSASNPNPLPVLYQVSATSAANGGNYPEMPTLTPVVHGTDMVTNKVTGQKSAGNIFDPDSLNLTPAGDLLLSNESGASITDIANVGQTNQSLTVLNLHDANGNPINTDDTGFATSSHGVLLFADSKDNVVYALTSTNGFAANQAFSSDKVNHSLDALNFGTGLLTPVVTGIGSSAGIGFIADASPAPEPTALALLVLGGAALLLTRRRSCGNR